MDPLGWIARAPLPFLARCRVPADLDSVTSIGAEARPSPGIDAGAIEGIWGAAEALYRTGVTPALQLCIRHRGRIVLNRSLGHARGNAPGAPAERPREPLTTETPINVFSSAKLVTAMIIHKLDEMGALHIEDRVCEIIPEFGAHGKKWITFRHLLSHRAGIPNLPSEALDLDLLSDPSRIAALVCDMEIASRPGRIVSYHAISTGFVLAEAVRRVTGETIREVLTKQIRQPLGLRWLHFGVTPEQVPLVAENALTGPPAPIPISTLLTRALGRPLREIVGLSNDSRFVTGIIPAGNLETTAEDLSAFLQCMLDLGEGNGVRIFEPRTIQHALNEASYREIDLTLGLPLRYGLGPMLGDDPVGIFGPNTEHAFGHLGLSNVFPWADPRREISVALLTTGKPIISLHTIRLLQLILAINAAFPRRRAASAGPLG
jgi:CubicO group peptidase (beta-lactamase class C family)